LKIVILATKHNKADCFLNLAQTFSKPCATQAFATFLHFECCVLNPVTG
jgi:hypothetical protein